MINCQQVWDWVMICRHRSPRGFYPSIRLLGEGKISSLLLTRISRKWGTRKSDFLSGRLWPAGNSISPWVLKEFIDFNNIIRPILDYLNLLSIFNEIGKLNQWNRNRRQNIFYLANCFLDTLYRKDWTIKYRDNTVFWFLMLQFQLRFLIFSKHFRWQFMLRFWIFWERLQWLLFQLLLRLRLLIYEGLPQQQLFRQRFRLPLLICAKQLQWQLSQQRPQPRFLISWEHCLQQCDRPQSQRQFWIS